MNGSLSSLSFGTTGSGGANALIILNAPLAVTNDLVVGQTGQASLNVNTGGIASVGGDLVVNSGGGVAVGSGAEVNVEGNVLANGGNVIAIGTDLRVSVGTGVVAENGSLFGFAAGATADVEGGLIVRNSGVFLVAGTGTTATVGGSLFAQPGGSVTVDNGGQVTSAAFSASTNGTLNVNTGGVFTTGTGDTTINATGTLNVTTGGTFHANGDFVTIGTVALELAATSSIPPLDIAGTATLGGALNLTPAAGFTPQLYNGVELITTGYLTGTFDRVEGHLLGDNTALAVTYTPTTVNVTRARIGDANLDGDVEINQFVIVNGVPTNIGDGATLLSNLGSVGTFIDGDFNGNGSVEINQFEIVNGAPTNIGDGASLLAALPTRSTASATVLSVLPADVVTGAATGEVLASYDPTTGEVTLDVGAGNQNIALAIFGGDLTFESEDFNAATSLGEALATSTAITLDLFFNLTDSGPEGAFNLGDILPAGLDAGSLANIFAVGGTGSTFSAITVAVPEPASLSLLALGGLALSTRRRRVVSAPSRRV